MVKRCLFTILVASLTAFAQYNSQPKTAKSEKPAEAKSAKAVNPAADTHFVRKAAEANFAEVQLGKLAQDKGSNQAVKDFGQHMVTDHTKALDALRPIASSKNVPIPDKMNTKDQALYDRLSKYSGDEFDREYMRAMVKDHEADVAEFRHESEKAKDTEVRSYASTTLPTLEDHLRMAQDASAKLAATAKK